MSVNIGVSYGINALQGQGLPEQRCSSEGQSLIGVH